MPGGHSVMDAHDALLSFTGNLPGVQQLVWFVAALLGVILAGSGIWMLATAPRRGGFAQGKGMGLSMLIFGALLVNTSRLLAVLAVTLSDGTVDTAEYVLSAVGPSGSPMHDWIAALLSICVVLGWISTTKGLYKLATVGGTRDQGWGAGLAWVLAGAALTNPHFFLHMVGASFGVESQVSVFIPAS